ncbi:conserved hypothetical protein [Nitrobacter hamburgensis X14]|uniref:Uncharacterized protein n=1 Tax=Nitrobacter hamburgensis (strain DSM 10229 / NCIMB 13809 / X14) TaxID=323097 RepID=Q1QL06_NITHX|nr:hypothetical protein [Nitrobacter hamburgensis]ABE63091.1 conserved hypothetical protein [Nitrobacter hamburgensis X14]
MSKTIAIAVSMALIGVPAALAQHKTTTGGSYDPGAAKSSPYITEAPVGHRQPRLSDVPAESTKAGNPDQIDPADAALDRKIKSICRGC